MNTGKTVSFYFNWNYCMSHDTGWGTGYPGYASGQKRRVVGSWRDGLDRCNHGCDIPDTAGGSKSTI